MTQRALRMTGNRYSSKPNGLRRIEGKAEAAEGHQRAQGINLSNC
jgi:hypothetical protein